MTLLCILSTLFVVTTLAGSAVLAGLMLDTHRRRHGGQRSLVDGVGPASIPAGAGR